MLWSALESLSKQRLDGVLSIDVVVVENNTTSSLSDRIDAYNTGNPDLRFRYVHECNPGIANARNAALSFAKAEKADYLAFMDDDEIADEGWLINLYSELDSRKLNLVGGPMRVFTRSTPPMMMQRLILDCLKRRSVRKERQSRYLRDNGRDGKIMLATNNWMVDLAFVCANKLKFEPRFNLIGGEDSWFFREARSHHALTGWAPDAIVHEEQPLERLSVQYQLRRSRDQSIVSFERKYAARRLYAWLVLPISIIYSLLLSSIFLLLAPLTVGRTLLTSIRLFGSATGRIMGLMGIRTQHYSQTTGY